MKLDKFQAVFQTFRLLKSATITFFMLGMFLGNYSYGQIELDISGGEVRGIPTAIVPFKFIDGASLQTNVASIISKNLAATGKFDPINPGRFLANPSSTEEVRYKDWRFLNAEILVIGEIWKIAEDNFEVRFRMFDVAREQEMKGGQVIPNLRGSDLRSVAHYISDQVYQAFTGRPGAFYSRISYIKRVEVEYQRFQYKLMVADWDGYGAAEVYSSDEPLLSPSWSPDAKKLAFVSFSDSGPIVQVLELVTGQVDVIASFKGVNSAPSWSPDGLRLAYSSSRHGSPDIFIYDFLTAQHERITTHYAIETEPSWSPSGDALLYTSSRTGRPQIYRYNFSDQEAQRVSFEGDDNANASYDYAGERIVMVHDGGKIIVMQGDTEQITLLSNAEFDESPSFSPNGDMVLYTAEYNYGSALVVTSSDGRVKTRLGLINGDVREPAWSSLKK